MKILVDTNDLSEEARVEIEMIAEQRRRDTRAQFRDIKAASKGKNPRVAETRLANPATDDHRVDDGTRERQQLTIPMVVDEGGKYARVADGERESGGNPERDTGPLEIVPGRNAPIPDRSRRGSRR